MDGSRFDSLTRLVSEASTRRTTLRSALGAAAASTVAVVGLATLAGETEAKKNKQRRRCKRRLRRERCDPRPAGSLCTTNEQCCLNETNRICALVPGLGETVCCGGTGANCVSNDNCCRHFACVAGFCRM